MSDPWRDTRYCGYCKTYWERGGKCNCHKPRDPRDKPKQPKKTEKKQK